VWTETPSEALGRRPVVTVREGADWLSSAGLTIAFVVCPRQVWEASTAPGQSSGAYISDILNCKPRHKHTP
jgi:hypothetical protein